LVYDLPEGSMTSVVWFLALLSLNTSKEDQEIKVTIAQKSDDDNVIEDEIIEPDQIDSLIEPESDADESKIDWTMGIIIAVVVNIIVALLAWFFYRRWKKGQDTDLIDLTGDMG